MRDSPEWKEILEIHSKLLQIWSLTDVERKRKEEEIVTSAIAWIRNNPNLVPDMLKLSMGEFSDGWRFHSYSPPLLEALGRSGTPEIIVPIQKRLQKCRYKICFHSKYLMKALMLLETPPAYRAIIKLVKPSIFRRRNYLISDFVDIMEENPIPELLSILLDIVRKTGVTYKVNYILAQLADTDTISFEKLLNDRSKRIRFVAIESLKFLHDKHLTDNLIDKLSRIMLSKREDILCRSYAADILKERNYEVPLQFRDQVWKNVSSDVERFVRGILYPSERPDDWAMKEMLEIPYEGGKAALRMWTTFGMITAEPYIRGNGHWKRITIGFHLFKAGRSNNYRIRGMGMSIQFEKGPFEVDYLIHNLDRIVIAIADDILGYSNQESSS